MNHPQIADTAFDDFLDGLKRYSVQEWLVCCAQFENSEYQKLQSNPDWSDRFGPLTQSFQRTAVAHYALRVSPHYRGPVGPSIRFPEVDPNAFFVAVDAYMKSENPLGDSGINSASKYEAYHFLAPVAYEQFSDRPVQENIIARGLLLYANYGNSLEDSLGHSISNLISVVCGTWLYGIDHPTFQLNQLFSWLAPLAEPDVLSRIIFRYCTNVRQYRVWHENEYGESLNRYEFKYLRACPIIKMDPSTFCVPVGIEMIKAGIVNIHHLLLNSYRTKSERDEFLRDLGVRFEKYVTDLFAWSELGPNSCGTIPGIEGVKSQKRAEFYVEIGDVSIVVECKKFSFRRDTLAGARKGEMDSEVKKVLSKAVSQLENSMEKLGRREMFGLIVALDYIPLANSSCFPIYLPKNVVLVSVAELERLLSFQHTEIVNILREFCECERSMKGDFDVILPRTEETRVHPYLGRVYSEFVKSSFPSG